MTAADPHGRIVDRIRSCYASWMNTPDAGRIRVRWYKLPPDQARVPGTYDLTDYSSSNFDTDPKSDDPPLGEESTTRIPFDDWRDCCPPPWPGLDGTLCTNAATACYRTYHLPRVTLSGVSVPPTSFPGHNAGWTASCSWASGGSVVSGVTLSWRLAAQNDGSVVVTLTYRRGVLQASMRAYTSPGPVDMTGPFRVRYNHVTPDPTDGPETIVIRPVEENVIGVDRCIGLGVPPDTFILVT